MFLVKSTPQEKNGRKFLISEHESKSEVASLMQRIDLEREAAQQGLTGLAYGTARHDFITARMERGAERILQLIQEDKLAEAIALMETETWGEEEVMRAER